MQPCATQEPEPLGIGRGSGCTFKALRARISAWEHKRHINKQPFRRPGWVDKRKRRGV